MPTPACPNIGPGQQRRRRLVAIAGLALAALVAVLVLALGMPRSFRLFVFPLTLVGALGALQAREQTCVALAARGLRNMDEGDEAVDDRQELEEMRTAARRIALQSLAAAGLVTAALIALPS